MNVFFRDFFSLTRIVLLGRTDVACERIYDFTLFRLLLYAALVGALLGLSIAMSEVFSGTVAAEDWASFSKLRAERFVAFSRIITLPFLLTAVTLVWVKAFAMLARRREENHELSALFFGSTVFLLPAAFPLAGPFLLPPLLLGWGCVLARYTAGELAIPPGRAFLYLMLPPATVWCLLQGVFFIVSRAHA